MNTKYIWTKKQKHLSVGGLISNSDLFQTTYKYMDNISGISKILVLFGITIISQINMFPLFSTSFD